MFELMETKSESAVIKVVGVGGGGSNAVHHMLSANIEGVDFICANTDAQALKSCSVPVTLQMGVNITKGLGAGANPEVGRQAAQEDCERIKEVLQGADMVFITAGMGGGTGTGAAPVVAQLAREMGVLTVAVVTKPFPFEGKKRMEVAMHGIRELSESVDSLITIPNEKLLTVLGKSASLLDAFKAANDVLLGAVQGIAELITRPGMINVDFADVRTVMSEMGMAMMGTGEATGQGRAKEAAQRAISSPLLEDVDISGATGVLLNITASTNLTLHEVNDAATMIHEAAHEDANIIFGAVIDESMGDNIRLTVIATGFDKDQHKTIPQSTFERIDVQSTRNVPTFTPSSVTSVPTQMTATKEKPTHIEVKLDEQSLSTPFISHKEIDSTEFKKRIRELGLDDNTEDEYDIPTFLRNQVD